MWERGELRMNIKRRALSEVQFQKLEIGSVFSFEDVYDDIFYCMKVSAQDGEDDYNAVDLATGELFHVFLDTRVTKHEKVELLID